MKTKITLTEYLQQGGKLSNLEMKHITTTFYDSRMGLGVVSIIPDRENSLGEQLYKVTYVTGEVHTYGSIWISVQVYVILHPDFTK